MIEIVGDKVQTSLWLDRDVKRLVEDEHLNLSRFVNKQILICLSVETEEEILGKIKEHEAAIKTLRSRLSLVMKRKKDKNSEDLVFKQALDELREYFAPRVDQGLSRESNLAWILSPKNVGRCKILKKSPEQVLDELEVWYDGIEKGKHEEN